MCCLTFAIPIKDVSGRMGLISTCVLAVLAYRFVVNELIPKKPDLTKADWYIIGTVFWMIIAGLESAVSAYIRRYCADDEEAKADGEEAEALKATKAFVTMTQLNYFDDFFGCGMFILLVGANVLFLRQWKKGYRQTWREVYEANEEPYCPLWVCTKCGHWCLAKGAIHLESDEAKRGLCEEAECGGKLRTVYLTPEEACVENSPDGQRYIRLLQSPQEGVSDALGCCRQPPCLLDGQQHIHLLQSPQEGVSDSPGCCRLDRRQRYVRLLQSPQKWEVAEGAGEAGRGGVPVRSGRSATSSEYEERLSAGALVEEVEPAAHDRLHYKLLRGTGPLEGWISTKVSGKDVAVKTSKDDRQEDPRLPEAPADVKAAAAKEA
eukprot:CAMPEP_0171181570 /NCGR_PEP_ID=MMETSP0790-20130122/14325_1 /TAXON_ID=2925 /ORGANISM="Alexandrium catenella, Strain OF101" /LENGTH=377 /DNA_ID=CAMNT_0011646507 /DNA_START=109 /DNA_END=1239 /DNA_ORIENTATION=+